MATADFNNGLILGLSLQGTLFIGDRFNTIKITAIESNTTQLRVKYNDDTEFTIFNWTEDVNTGVITYYCTKNGAIVVLTPMAAEDIIYKQMEA